MGSNWSQQACLKLSPAQGLIRPPKLKVGGIYNFKKEKQRLYMIDTPMNLLSDKWEAIGMVLITEITVKQTYTKGKYKVLKIFNPKDAAAISRNLIPYYKFR
ncbi:MAG: DUF2584 family protein [Patescibacteria group bacterium]|nr:DUF2584 family protein [Patescibacteria group bacterium]